MRRSLVHMALLATIAVGCGGTAPAMVLEPDEKVIGRAYQKERVRLLTSASRLVTVGLRDHVLSTMSVTGLVDQAPWGLAQSSDGALWTLLGTSQLTEIDPHGQIRHRREVDVPVVGLFGLDGLLLVQPAVFEPGTPVLHHVHPETMSRRGFGSLRSSAFETRAEMLTRNLVSCGSGQGTELPCWLSHGLIVDRVSTHGQGRQQALSGVGGTPAARDGGVDFERQGPIVDAHIDGPGDLWVLVRRENERGVTEYLLARYGSDAALVGIRLVPGQPRLILDVDGSQCLIFIGTGQLATVEVG